MKNYYKELGLDPKLDKKEIEAKLKALHKRVRSKADNASTRKKRATAYERLEIIEEALDILLDDKKRIEYDNRLFQNKDDNKNKDTKKDDTNLSYLSNSAETNKSSDAYIVNERTKNKEADKASKATIVNGKQTASIVEDEEIKLDFETIEKYRKMGRDLEAKIDRELEKRGLNKATPKEPSKNNLKQSIGVEKPKVYNKSEADSKPKVYNKSKIDSKIKKDNKSLQEKEWMNSLKEVNELHEKVKQREKIKKETERKKKTVDTYSRNSTNQSRNYNIRPNNTSYKNETNTTVPETNSNPEKQNIFARIFYNILALLFITLRFIFTKGGFIVTLLICGIIFLTVNPKYLYIFDPDKYTMHLWLEDGDYTKLHWYAKTENNELAFKEIKKKKDIDKQTDEGLTPLHFAVETGNIELVNKLIEAGANVNLQNEGGSTPLVYAAGEYSEIAIKLIEAGADVNIKNNHGYTPLHSAVSGTQTELISRLIEEGADVNIQNNDGNTPIFYAKEKSIAEELIAAGANVNIQNNGGSTPIFHVNEKSIAEELIDAGAKFNIVNNEGESVLDKMISLKGFDSDKERDEFIGSILDSGAVYGEQTLKKFIYEDIDIEIIQKLIEMGVDLNKPLDDEGRWPPMHYAAMYNKLEIAKALIKNGANVNGKDKNGATPICYAEYEMVKLLIDNGADVNIVTDGGATPMFYVEDKETVRLFVQKGLKVNTANDYGYTPLHSSANGNGKDAEVVEELIKYGADVNAQDDGGDTPLHKVTKGYKRSNVYKKEDILEYKKEDRKVMKILLEAGADTTIENNEGHTALEYVSEDRKIIEGIFKKYGK